MTVSGRTAEGLRDPVLHIHVSILPQTSSWWISWCNAISKAGIGKAPLLSKTEHRRSVGKTVCAKLPGQKTHYGENIENCRNLMLSLHLIALISIGTSWVNDQVLTLQLRLTCQVITGECFPPWWCLSMNLLQARQCSRGTGWGALSCLNESYLAGHQHGVWGVTPSPRRLLGQRHRAQSRRGAGDKLEWMRKEWFVSLFAFGSGCQGRHQGEGGTWSGMVGFQRWNPSEMKCHISIHISLEVKGDMQGALDLFSGEVKGWTCFKRLETALKVKKKKKKYFRLFHSEGPGNQHVLGIHHKQTLILSCHIYSSQQLWGPAWWLLLHSFCKEAQGI